MCQVFKVSTSGYYHWLKAKPSKRWLENEVLLMHIKDIFKTSHNSYGSPRMTEELVGIGYHVSRPRIARIMSNAGIAARKPRKFKTTTNSKHNYQVAPNLLDRQFNTEKPNQVWVSDITYIRTTQGWLYLTVIIDLFNRKVVGWSISEDMTANNTSIAAWKMAIEKHDITNELIFHSDRGIQYACEAFTDLLNDYNGLVKQSMSRKGNCWDNAVAESFFKSLKVEWVYQNKYLTRNDAKLSIFEYIETWYNTNRRHSAIGYKTIKEFEKLFINHTLVA